LLSKSTTCSILVFEEDSPAQPQAASLSGTNMGPFREPASILCTLLFDIRTFAAVLRISGSYIDISSAVGQISKLPLKQTKVRKQEMGWTKGNARRTAALPRSGIIIETHSPEAHATSAACVRTTLSARFPSGVSNQRSFLVPD